MTDFAVTLFLTILSVMPDWATEPRLRASYCHLAELSTAIDAHDNVHDASWFLAIAQTESHFDYLNPHEVLRSSANACGVYQQVPRWAAVPVVCEELRNPWTATEVAAAKFDRVLANFGPLDEGNICHYCGQECSSTPPDPSLNTPKTQGEWRRASRAFQCYTYGERRTRHASRIREVIARIQCQTSPATLEYWRVNLSATCQEDWARSEEERRAWASIRDLAQKF